MLPLRDRIADELMADEARPFDAVLKSIFEKRHVLKRFVDAYVPRGLGPDQPDQYDFSEDDGVEFLKEEFRPDQEKWFADKVARVGEDLIVHIEQQTSHNRVQMFTRMLQYATFITTFYEFDIKLMQIYYYTGDRPIAPPANDGVTTSGNYAVQNHFIFVDAGAHDAWAMLRSGNPYFAILGLLSRNIGDYERYLADLIGLGKHHFSEGDLREWLVACTAVACLRGRHRDILRMLQPIMQNQVLNDPIIRAFTNKGQLEGRALARDFYERTQALKASLRRSRMPRNFLDWIMLKASEHDMSALERAIMPGMTFEQLVKKSGVEWHPDQTHRYG